MDRHFKNVSKAIKNDFKGMSVSKMEKYIKISQNESKEDIIQSIDELKILITKKPLISVDELMKRCYYFTDKNFISSLSKDCKIFHKFSKTHGTYYFTLNQDQEDLVLSRDVSFCLRFRNLLNQNKDTLKNQIRLVYFYHLKNISFSNPNVPSFFGSIRLAWLACDTAFEISSHIDEGGFKLFHNTNCYSAFDNESDEDFLYRITCSFMITSSPKFAVFDKSNWNLTPHIRFSSLIQFNYFDYAIAPVSEKMPTAIENKISQLDCFLKPSQQLSETIEDAVKCAIAFSFDVSECIKGYMLRINNVLHTVS